MRYEFAFPGAIFYPHSTILGGLGEHLNRAVEVLKIVEFGEKVYPVVSGRLAALLPGC